MLGVSTIRDRDRVFKIGEFSRFSNISVKMLRHYDELGLMPPARIDPDSGYRYYSADQLPRLNRIVALKELGFSLEQIGTLLDGRLSHQQLVGMLKLRQAELQADLSATQRRLDQVEDRLAMIEQEKHPAYEVVVRAIPAQLVASSRQTVDLDSGQITAMFESTEAYVAQHQARAGAAPLTIFHDEDYRETEMDVEVLIPLSQPIPPTESIHVDSLAAVDQMACVVYTGSYDKTPQVLNHLLGWIEQRGYQIAGRVREVYVRYGTTGDFGLPDAVLTSLSAGYVTEVQLPITVPE